MPRRPICSSCSRRSFRRTEKITVSSPSLIDIPADQTKTGGNSFPGIDTVIVRDYETILAQLDEIFAEVDVKPRQVVLEAMILSVKQTTR